MKKRNAKTYILWVTLSEAVGLLSGWLTRDGVDIYNATAVKPPLSPPPIVFPIVWTILFALMGIGAARIWLNESSKEQSQSIILFIIQLLFNFFWSIIFFNLQNFGLAFFWILVLWALILLMILSFRKVDTAAAALQIPYLLWVTFAAYLNFAVWILNK